MKKIIILTGVLISITGMAEIWEPPPYQPDENHLPPEERQQEEEKPSLQKDKEVKKDRNDKKIKEEHPGRPLFPVK